MDDRTTQSAAGGVIRRLWVTETRQFREHLARLDSESRRTRFAGSVSPHYVETYANDALKRATAVYGWFEGGTLRATAELHGPMFSRTAEAAFCVEPGYQGRGIGTALMERIVLSARNRGIQHLVVSYLSENSPMQKIAKQHGADIEFHTGETVGTVHPNFPTGLSLLREAIVESHGFASAMAQAQMSLFTRYLAMARQQASPSSVFTLISQ